MSIPEDKIRDRRVSSLPSQSMWDKLLELEKRLEENTKATMDIKNNTANIIEAFDAMQGAFKSIEFLAKLGKPLIWIGTAIILSGAVLTNFKAQLIAFFK